MSGSYNWTRSADRDNRDNNLITWDEPTVRAFTDGFERLWKELG